ncbi:unnamed protein product [Symbiodinium sp. CCMP2592]|nr:unnamed protein product [Symbiodinium sp. CCMP2592]
MGVTFDDEAEVGDSSPDDVPTPRPTKAQDDRSKRNTRVLKSLRKVWSDLPDEARTQLSDAGFEAPLPSDMEPDLLALLQDNVELLPECIRQALPPPPPEPTPDPLKEGRESGNALRRCILKLKQLGQEKLRLQEEINKTKTKVNDLLRGMQELQEAISEETDVARCSDTYERGVLLHDQKANLQALRASAKPPPDVQAKADGDLNEEPSGAPPALPEARQVGLTPPQKVTRQPRRQPRILSLESLVAPPPLTGPIFFPPAFVTDPDPEAAWQLGLVAFPSGAPRRRGFRKTKKASHRRRRMHCEGLFCQEQVDLCSQAVDPAFPTEHVLVEFAARAEDSISPGSSEEWFLEHALDAIHDDSPSPPKWHLMKQMAHALSLQHNTPHNPASFRLLSANVTHWRPEVRDWAFSLEAHGVMLQELHLTAEAAHEAAIAATKRGLRLFTSPPFLSDKKRPLGGFGVLIRSFLNPRHVLTHAVEGCGFLAVSLRCSGFELTLVSIYLQSGTGFNSPVNAEVLARLLAFLPSLRGVWIVAGDWNNTIQELLAARLEEVAHGRFLGSGSPTAATDREIDYLFVSAPVVASLSLAQVFPDPLPFLPSTPRPSPIAEVNLLGLTSSDQLSLDFAELSSFLEASHGFPDRGRGAFVPLLYKPLVQSHSVPFSWKGQLPSLVSAVLHLLDRPEALQLFLWSASDTSLPSEVRAFCDRALVGTASSADLRDEGVTLLGQLRRTQTAQQADQYAEWLEEATGSHLGPLFRAIKSHEQVLDRPFQDCDGLRRAFERHEHWAEVLLPFQLTCVQAVGPSQVEGYRGLDVGILPRRGSEHSKLEKTHIVSLFLDLRGFFDSVYQGPRCLVADSIAATPLFPGRGVAALPSVTNTDLWLDDVSLDVVGPDPVVVASAALQAYRVLHSSLGLEGLEVETTKTKFVAGTVRARAALNQLRRPGEPETADLVKDLGLDCAAGRRRRITTAQNVSAPAHAAMGVAPKRLKFLRAADTILDLMQASATHGWKIVNGPVSALIQYFLDLQVSAPTPDTWTHREVTFHFRFQEPGAVFEASAFLRQVIQLERWARIGAVSTAAGYLVPAWAWTLKLETKTAQARKPSAAVKLDEVDDKPWRVQIAEWRRKLGVSTRYNPFDRLTLKIKGLRLTTRIKAYLNLIVADKTQELRLQQKQGNGGKDQCKFCGQPNTLRHLLYECERVPGALMPSGWLLSFRRRHPDECLWLRGMRPLAPRAPLAHEAEVRRTGLFLQGTPDLTGLFVATDASGGPATRDSRLRSVGWAIVVASRHQDALNILGTMTGLLPAPATVPEGESEAIAQALLSTRGTFDLTCDCRPAIRSLQGTFTKRTPLVWSKAWDHRHRVDPHWAPTFSAPDFCMEFGADALWRHELNALADKLAGERAEEVQTPHRLAAQREVDRVTSLLCEYPGRRGAAIPARAEKEDFVPRKNRLLSALDASASPSPNKRQRLQALLDEPPTLEGTSGARSKPFSDLEVDWGDGQSSVSDLPESGMPQEIVPAGPSSSDLHAASLDEWFAEVSLDDHVSASSVVEPAIVAKDSGVPSVAATAVLSSREYAARLRSSHLSLQDATPKFFWEQGFWSDFFGPASVPETIMPRFKDRRPDPYHLPSSEPVELGQSQSSKKARREFAAVFQKVVVQRQVISWRDAREASFETAIVKWVALFGSWDSNRDESLDGFAQLSELEQRNVIDHSIARKAPSTALKRANSLIKLTKLAGAANIVMPASEGEIYIILTDAKSGGAPLSQLRGFMEAITFSRHVFEIRSLHLVSVSKRCWGVTVARVATPARQADPLRVKDLKELHRVLDEAPDPWDRCFAGSALFCAYGRCRWSDSHLDDIELEYEEGPDSPLAYVGGVIDIHKTMNLQGQQPRVLEIIAPAQGIYEGDWALKWLAARAEVGCAWSQGHPTMPAPNHLGEPTVRALGSDECGAWLRALLPTRLDMRTTSHSLKATFLSYCAKRGMSHLDRLALGGHSHGAKSADTYARDALARPLRLLQGVIREISMGVFIPDANRAGRLIVSAETSELAQELGHEVPRVSPLPLKTAGPLPARPKDEVVSWSSFEPSPSQHAEPASESHECEGDVSEADDGFADDEDWPFASEDSSEKVEVLVEEEPSAAPASPWPPLTIADLQALQVEWGRKFSAMAEDLASLQFQVQMLEKANENLRAEVQDLRREVSDLKSTE